MRAFSPHRRSVMGKADYRHREVKKPKKGAKKTVSLNITETPAEVPVVRKPRAPKEEA